MLSSFHLLHLPTTPLIFSPPLFPPSKPHFQAPHNLLHSSPASPPKHHFRTLLNPLQFSPLLEKPCGYLPHFADPSSFLDPPEEAGGLDFNAELGHLLAILPEQMRQRLSEHEELHQLIEVVMDLGRKPLARFPSGDFVLSQSPITFEDIDHATPQVGEFDSDNRAGISKTLHRICAIKNRKGAIVGLTCRIGRAISGSADVLRDLVQDGASLLMVGPPGVGKTTIIRELARILANDYKKRVMIVDTSNEIGGYGDIPHAGIGDARRMQVPTSIMQHKVLIEAVENHMPQVIVIDEIGTKLEVIAASTIAQRGIQLVASAHGLKIENLIRNPTLDMLVGGIESVTLGDTEACRRGVQKTVLERKGSSPFSSAVEMSMTELRIHKSLDTTVDAILSGHTPTVLVRRVKARGLEGEASSFNAALFHLYVHGIDKEIAMRGIKQLKLDAVILLTDDISEADALLALQSKIKRNSRIQAAAKFGDIPIYMMKTTSLAEITKAILALVRDHADKDGKSDYKLGLSENIDALEEARIAIEEIVIPKGEPVELLPRPPHIRSCQMDLVQKYQLHAETIVTKLDERICIRPILMTSESGQHTVGKVDQNNGFDDSKSTNSRTSGLPFGTAVTRLLASE